MSKKWFAVSCGGLLGVALLWSLSGVGEAAGAGGLRLAMANRPAGRLVSEVVGRLLILRSQLNVTEEQREKVETIVKSHRDEIGPLAKFLVAKGRALRAAVTADTPDEQTIRRAADDLGKAIGDAALLASKVRGEVRAVMTPEQIKAIEEFRAGKDGAVDRWLIEMPKAMAEN